jgi:hypothetical protein
MKSLSAFLVALAFSAGTVARADDLPYLSPLRDALVTQLTIVTSTVPANKPLASTLSASLKLVDRTKPEYVAGSASIGTLANLLLKTSLSNEFRPILEGIRDTYVENMAAEEDGLNHRVALVIPGKTQTAAQTAIGKFSVALDLVSTNPDFKFSLPALKKAAAALLAADKAVVKAETAKPGASFLTATVLESGQPATTLKPTAKTILEATYDPFFGEIDIDAGDMVKLGGTRVGLRFLSLTAMVSGPGTYTLSLTNDAQGYAVYERAILADIRDPYPEPDSQEFFATIDPFNQRLGSGTMTITLSEDSSVVWGSFSFTGLGIEVTSRTATITGTFLMRVETFE